MHREASKHIDQHVQMPPSPQKLALAPSGQHCLKRTPQCHALGVGVAASLDKAQELPVGDLVLRGLEGLYRHRPLAIL
eukprot:1139049-Pelagomonas_calceolata.AAC.5